MRSIVLYIFFSVYFLSSLSAQSLDEAKELYLQGEFEKALPIFETYYNEKPNDASLNQWYGVCLFETGGDIQLAEKCLLTASKKNIQDSFYYLGKLYTKEFRFTEAKEALDSFEKILSKKKPRKKDEISKHEADLKLLEDERKYLSRLNRMVSNTEDIQIIDSMVVDQKDFLSAYKLSISSGRIDYFNNVFNANRFVESIVYFNEKETKIYYAQPDEENVYSLFSMEKLLDEFGNEKKLSPSNFGLNGDLNYPYVMPDGVTIYFAAKDEETLGGYDLFITRYNLNNDTYLTPERLNMPFNSLFNDYMMVVDEEKGIGWFASDRFQPEGLVCIYTFIPNKVVKIIDSEDEAYMANRARISSIKSSWDEGEDYTSLIELARTAPERKKEEVHDFEFVIDDKSTYYRLADFKKTIARDTYYKVVQKKAELKTTIEKLEELRLSYNKSNQDGRRNMSAEILRLEKAVEALQKEIPVLEMQARNQEIQK